MKICLGKQKALQTKLVVLRMPQTWALWRHLIDMSKWNALYCMGAKMLFFPRDKLIEEGMNRDTKLAARQRGFINMHVNTFQLSLLQFSQA